MRWALALGSVCLVLSMAAPLVAWGAPADDLRRAKDHFEYGEYEEARRVAEELLTRNVLAADESLIEANRIVALAYLYGDRQDRLQKAQAYFLQLLSIEPDYRLDPFFTPPAAVAFFDEVRTEHEERLAPIREQRRLAKQARAAEEAARRRFLEERRKEQVDAGAGILRVVERRHLPVVFLPFGAGQFQNGQKGAGVTIASIQVGAGLTSLVSYLIVDRLQGADGGYAPEDLRTARTFDTVKWASAAVFYLSWVYGALDAWAGFEQEVVHERPLEPALVPSVGVSGDGASVGLSLRF